MDWAGERTRRRFERGRREEAEWRHSNPLTAQAAEVVEWLRSCDPKGSTFVKQMQAKARKSGWTPTPRQEDVVRQIIREREARAQRFR